MYIASYISGWFLALHIMLYITLYHILIFILFTADNVCVQGSIRMLDAKEARSSAKPGSNTLQCRSIYLFSIAQCSFIACPVSIKTYKF